MKAREQPSILRGVAFHGQPRMLAHPSAEGVLQAPRAANARSDAAAKTPARAAATTWADATLAPGFAEGFELGRQEGRRVGELEGREAANAHGKDALRRALEAQQDEARLRQEAALMEHHTGIHSLGQLQRDFHAAAMTRLHSLEEDAVALAFEALCKILGHGAGQADQLARSIAEAMRMARERSVLRIRVRPEAQSLLATTSEGRALMLTFEQIEWLADPRVQGDGCILDTDAGTIDARMGVQLDGLRRLWNDAMLHHAPMEAAPPST